MPERRHQLLDVYHREAILDDHYHARPAQGVAQGLSESADAIASQLPACCLAIEGDHLLGQQSEADPTPHDRLVASPGIPLQEPAFLQLVEAGVLLPPAWSVSLVGFPGILPLPSADQYRQLLVGRQLRIELPNCANPQARLDYPQLLGLGYVAVPVRKRVRTRHLDRALLLLAVEQPSLLVLGPLTTFQPDDALSLTPQQPILWQTHQHVDPNALEPGH